MNGKLLLVALLVAGTAGAYIHFWAKPSPLDVLMRTPESFPEASEAGIKEIAIGSIPERCCEPGRITVLAYYSIDCPGCCRKLRKQLQSFVELRPDVAVRLVGLPNTSGGADYRSRYGIDLRSVPHVMIYDTAGELLAGDDGTDKAGLDLLRDWMNAERTSNWQRDQDDAQ